MNTIHRTILPYMIERLRHETVAVVVGARQTGKTTLCELQIPAALQKDVTYITFDDPDERARFSRSAVAILENISTPLIVLDEVQKHPQLFDPLKLVVDREKRKPIPEQRRFLLTGSSQLLMLGNIRETLAGRVALSQMYPFSLREVCGAKATPLLTTLWQNPENSGDILRKIDLLTPQQIRVNKHKRDELRTWGGYPPVWQRADEAARIAWLKDYRKTFLERDIADVGHVANIDTFSLAQKLLCAHSGNLLNISEIARDLGVAVNTVKRYLELLTMSFQCFLVPPWFSNSPKRLVKSPKIFFPDAGINRAILGEMSISEGAKYESWICNELMQWKQYEAEEPDLYFYRTHAGLEIDFLLAGTRGILPIEVKSSQQVSAKDGRSVETFLQEYPAKARMGIVAYPGDEVSEIRPNVWAIPDWYLFC